jgi:hypothetical protein
MERFRLLWRRFSPLEEQLIAEVRKVLPFGAQIIFDPQVAAITRVQRHANEICFYRLRAGKADWSSVPTFPRASEFRLAEVRFRAREKNYKATLTSIRGHIFDFTILPNPKAVMFAKWEPGATARLLSDPLTVEPADESQPIPVSWREFLIRAESVATGDWKLRDAKTAYRIAFNDGEFLVLAERDGDQFILHRIDPPASTLFYVDSHDAMPEPIQGGIVDVFQRP